MMFVVKNFVRLGKDIAKFLGKINYKEVLEHTKKGASDYRQEFTKEAYVMREKMKDLGTTNYELGVSHLVRGNLADAIMRFKIALKMHRHEPECHAHLSRCYMIKGKYDLARTHLEQALTLGISTPLLAYARQYLTAQNNPRPFDALPDALLIERSESIPERQKELKQRKLLSQEAEAAATIFIEHAVTHKSEESPVITTIRALDISCTSGLYAKAFAAALKKNNITFTCDSAEASEITYKQLLADKLYKQMIHAQPLSILNTLEPSYDIVFTGQLLHTTATPGEALKACLVPLKQGGWLITHFIVSEDKIEEVTFDTSAEAFLYPSTLLESEAESLGLRLVETKTIATPFPLKRQLMLWHRS